MPEIFHSTKKFIIFRWPVTVGTNSKNLKAIKEETKNFLIILDLR